MTGARGGLSPWHAPIDNNPTPSYLSVNLGWLRFTCAFRVDFARKEPHSGAPEAKSGRRDVVKSGQSKVGAPV
jgi:hypothetical protein